MKNKTKFITNKELIEYGMRQPLLDIDRTVFEKNEAEKLLLKDLKRAHKYHLRSNGFDPRKQINLPNAII